MNEVTTIAVTTPISIERVAVTAFAGPNRAAPLRPRAMPTSAVDTSR